MENPPKKFFRLSPGAEVRLRYAYFITCREVVKNAAGEVIELRCTYDPATKGGNAPDGRKVKATLHWVSAARRGAGRGAALQSAVHAARSERRAISRPTSIRNSLEVIADARVEPALAAIGIRCGGAVRTPGLFLPGPGFDARQAGVQPHRRPARHLGEGFRRLKQSRLATRDRASCSMSPLIVAREQLGARSGRRGWRTRSRAHGARSGARTWPLGGARPAWSGLGQVRGSSSPSRRSSAQWAMAEVGAGRLLPWFAVASAPASSSTSPRSASRPCGRRRALAVGCAPSRIVLLRARPVGFVLALGFFAIAAGFAVATLKTALIDHPVLRFAGVRRRRRGLRRIARGEPADRPLRAARRTHRRRPHRREAAAGAALGQARHGAAGRALSSRSKRCSIRRCSRCGPAATISPATCISRASARRASCAAPSRSSRRRRKRACWQRANAFIQGLRDAIDARIRAVVARRHRRDRRDADRRPARRHRSASFDAMFVSGIGHVLSISGYHMAVVAGVVFFVFRAVLGADPGPRRPGADQEMGGLRGARRHRRSIWCCRAPRSRRSAPSS